jgi:uncharacterized protein (PEP-CTERM system associated)
MTLGDELKRRMLLMGWGLVLGAAIAGEGWAGDWTGDTGVNVNARYEYSSRVDSQEVTGPIIQIRPFVSGYRAGSRASMRINYGPSVLIYPGDDQYNDVQHVLAAIFSTEVIERYFFVDAIARANQVLINPRVNRAFDSATDPNAFTQTASVQVRPRIILPVAAGRFATVRIEPGLGVGWTASTADGQNDNVTRRQGDSSVVVNSGPMFTKVPWSISWRSRIFDIDDDRGYDRVDLRVGYIFNRRYRLWLTLGYDDGSRAFTADDGDSRGVRWEVSFLWTPKPLTSVEAGIGQAYFGDTFRLNARHRHKRWVFGARYDIEIQDATSEIIEQQVVPVEDAFGDLIPVPITGPDVVEANVLTPVLIDDTFLRDRFELSADYSKGRNSASGAWFLTRRDYDTRDLDTLDNQIRLRYTRRISPKFSATATARFWDHTEDNPAAVEFQRNEIDLQLNYRLGQRTSVGALIGVRDQQADDDEDSFTDQRGSLFVSIRF